MIGERTKRSGDKHEDEGIQYKLTWYEEEAVPKRKLLGRGGYWSNPSEIALLRAWCAVNKNSKSISIDDTAFSNVENPIIGLSHASRKLACSQYQWKFHICTYLLVNVCNIIRFRIRHKDG